MSTETSPPTRLELELWALGELEGEALAALQARLDADPELAAHAARVRERLTEAAADLPLLDLPELPAQPAPEALPDLPPRDALTDAGEPAADTARPPPDNVVPLFRRPAVRAVLALAAVLLAAVLVQPFVPSGGPGPDTRFRGSLDIELVRVRLGEASPQDTLVSARAGDRLQYTVTSPTDGYLQVFDLQDDGVLSTWLPTTPAPAMRPVKGAAVLDDYAGSERVFFLVSPVPVDETAVRESLSRAWDTPIAELDTLPGFDEAVHQRSVLVIKEEATR